MSWPTIRSDSDVLRALVIGVGLCWSVAFVAVALRYELELYADGAMFSYAVAVQDVWAFHWHNISGRLSVFLLSLLPAEIYVGLSRNPGAGIVVYGLLFYLAPLAGLIGTFAADRSHGRIIFVYACCSTALLCPLVFGFPTEMWMAHAVFWPALAVSHYAKRTVAGTALFFVMLLTLAFTHEGALVLAFAIVATLGPRGWRDASFLRAAAALIAVLAVSVAAKIMMPPDEYYAGVLMRAALHFFDLTIFQVSIVLLLFAAFVGYGVIFLVLSRLAPERAYLYAAASVMALLSIYWLWLDHTIHASSRYYLRTALVIVTPVFGALAALGAIHGDGRGAEPGGSAACGSVYGFDAGARDRDRKIRYGVERLPSRSRGSRDGRSIRSGARQSAFRFFGTNRARFEPAVLVLDDAILVGGCCGLQSEPACYRSDWKLFLVILRHGNGECQSCARDSGRGS
jgi:hypothetical protein